jgi:steroid 5-alpha reductase family enzyme
LGALQLTAIGTVLASTLMVVAWLVYRRTGKASWVDAFWAGNLAVLAALYAAAAPGDGTRRAVVLLVGAGWGMRLAIHIALRVARGPEDPRYVALAAEWKDNVPARFFRFYMMQALVDVVLSIPFLLMARDPSPFGRGTELAGLALWGVALAGESLADAQLARFKRDAANRGRVCRVGLWGMSRHPNYFFEWLLWCAFALMASGAPMGWVSWSAPLMMLYFLLRVTGIPLTEQQAVRSRGAEYRRYQREVSPFVPWFARRPSEVDGRPR